MCEQAYVFSIKKFTENKKENVNYWTRKKLG